MKGTREMKGVGGKGEEKGGKEEGKEEGKEGKGEVGGGGVVGGGERGTVVNPFAGNAAFDERYSVVGL